MTYYSQYGEDQILGRLFAGRVGWCVEVGANDGVTYSMSKHLEDIGWQCILVEPTPSLCLRIRATRSAQLFECAASFANGTAELQFVEDMDLFSSLENQSTMQDRIEGRRAAVTRIQVQTRRLDDILTEARAPQVDILSVDVEGHELAVLQGLSLETWQPTYIVVEDDTDLGESAVSRHLFSNGYKRFYRTGGNDWYARGGEMGVTKLLKLIVNGTLSVPKVARATAPAGIRSGILRTLRGVRTRRQGG